MTKIGSSSSPGQLQEVPSQGSSKRTESAETVESSQTQTSTESPQADPTEAQDSRWRESQVREREATGGQRTETPRQSSVRRQFDDLDPRDPNVRLTTRGLRPRDYSAEDMMAEIREEVGGPTREERVRRAQRNAELREAGLPQDAVNYIDELYNLPPNEASERRSRRFGDWVVWSGRDRTSGTDSVVDIMRYNETGPEHYGADGHHGFWGVEGEELSYQAAQRGNRDMNYLVEGLGYSPREARNYLVAQGQNLAALMAVGIAGVNPGLPSHESAIVGRIEQIERSLNPDSAERGTLLDAVAAVLPDAERHFGTNEHANQLNPEQRLALWQRAVSNFPIQQ